ncbi:MAG: ATP-NAD kinase family protein [Pseudomonadales bacterium]|nr:ATP-NAD kinase family protein [Pseudomonadales bacterium]
MNTIKIGLIVNPYAGIGGAVALKGSDGEQIVGEALKRGAQPRALQRVQLCLQHLKPIQNHIKWYCWGGQMGESSLQQAGFTHHVVGQPKQAQSQASDTTAAALALKQTGVDLILFAGGDGTARDLVSALGCSVPCLGIPAGVKIHSGVYAVHAKGAAEIIIKMVQAQLVSVQEVEVRDIDEEAFRRGQVKARRFGDLLVPAEERYLQHVKCGGKEVEALVLQDIAHFLIEQFEHDQLIILGPGTTTKAVADAMGLPKTLLGVDLILNECVLQADATEQQIIQRVEEQRSAHAPNPKIIVTLIGGQGHIFGRGNHQISPTVIEQVDKDNITVISTKTKLKELEGRPLLVDTWDEQVNQALAGFLPVVTGYEDVVLYPVEG